MTEATIKTATLTLADELEVLAAHLRAFPHLPRVNVDKGLPNGLDLQITGSDGAGGVLVWAKTLTDKKITIQTVTDWTGVYVFARIADVKVRVWDSDHGDISRWVSGDSHCEITLAQLTDYVAAGTVEGLGAR
ncbi:hypothetical protein L3Q65_45885 [Amycolatopsis sp. FU40]|uniref:hypothetical protein n=1 Tax=Amycolatopsis sp. FU40 TaxID=2914159 RepID=UPI001F2575BA|nr:hypothetical protein [Amycolatopsis sp. FU40]UKD55106.1 hypothetical protein L3Q65_45885 [Amycolatopsis sp. FU40]